MTDSLTTVEVPAIHSDQIERNGGAPQTGYYADVVEEAAALWESLSQNHPFRDGNKRVGFAAAYTFLAINGLRLTAGADEICAFLGSLYEANRFAFENLVPWLRENVEGDRI